MSSKLYQLTCPFCGMSQQTTLGITLLGFHKCECSSCHKKIELPLTSSARTIFWIWIGGFVTIFIVGLMTGRVFKPGILMFFGAWALYEDIRLRKNTVSLQLSEVSSAPVPLKKTLWDKFKLILVAIGVIILLAVGGILYAVFTA